MKTTRYLNRILLLAVLVSTIFIGAACSDNQGVNDSKEVAEERNDEKFDDSEKENDAQFLVLAAEMNLEEIQPGKLAQQRGTGTEVKELGKMMEDVHTKSLNELKDLASSKNISIPTSSTADARDAYNDLNEKSGEDFDKAYADKMVDGHQDTIDTFENAAEDSQDSEIKNWASTSLPGLRAHLEHSRECQKKLADGYLIEKN